MGRISITPLKRNIGIALVILCVCILLVIPATKNIAIDIIVIIGVAIAAYAWLARHREYQKALELFRWSPDLTPTQFEEHCADYLKLIGWRTQTTKGSGDQGADVIAEKSGIKVVLQCKKYSKPVGNKAVQEAIAAKAFFYAHFAVVVTNSSYTPSANALASRAGVSLLHFTQLSELDRILVRSSLHQGSRR